MTTTVENRVVKMQFDNATFKKEALATKSSLEQVDAAVAKTGNGKGLLSLGTAMDTVKVKAGAMQVATITAIANITNRAINAGINIAKSFTLDPIKQGFDEYELKMKSIQTILANTKGENLGSVTKALNELNTYSDKTIYNFANMTENIGKLTTAGISLEDSTAVVKGFSNMVALAGGDATAAAGAMEQFGQGLQAGAIKAIDWMSISNRGLGSQNLQKAFFETARAAGDLADVPLTTSFEEWSKNSGGFKASLESGWLTTDVATKTLKIMTGDMQSVEELMKQGFSRQAAEDLIDIANNALDSATKVRTFSAFMDTTKEALASGWGQVMEVIFGDFNESTKLFTKLSGITGDYIKRFFGYISRLLAAFDQLGGRTAVLETIKNVLSPILALLGLIAKAWTMVFGGGDTGSGLATFAKALQHITRPLRLLGELISGQITPFEFLSRLIQVVSNGIRNLSRYIGDFIKPLTDMVGIDLPSGGGIFDFFDKLVALLKSADEQFKSLRKTGASVMGALGGIDFDLPSLPSLPDLSGIALPKFGALPDFNSMFSGFSTDGATSELDQVAASLGGVTEEGQSAVTIGEKVKPAISEAWKWLKGFFDGFNAEDLMASFNLAVLSTFMISVSRFFNTLSDSFRGFVGVGDGVTGVLEGAQGALQGFADGKKAQLITAYAIAIGVLAAALWLLSRIPADKMVTALAGMAGIMLIMRTGVDSITKAVEAMDGKGTPLKLTGLALALLALGVAVLTLSVAFLILNKVDWSSMLKGLLTIVVIMKLLEKMGQIGKGGAANLFATAVALTALSFSLVVIAGALMLFQLVQWESMAKAGLVLGAITIALMLMGKVPAASLLGAAAAMVAIAASMLILANALIIFQLVQWESIGKLAVVLVALTAAIAALMFVGGGPAGAATIFAIGAALLMIAGAALILNSVDWSSIGKLALVLTVLVLGFAAFLAVISFFAPALIILSGFAGSIAFLALALTGLALAFAIVFPLLAAGTGVFAAFATGAAVAIGVFLTTLALQAPIMKKSILQILQVIIDTIVEAVPMVIDGIKRLFTAIVEQFSGGGGKGGGGKGVEASVGKTSESWMKKIIDSIKKKIPEIAAQAVIIGGRFLNALTEKAPAIAAMGVQFVIGLLNGIASKVGGIVTAAVNLAIAFANGLKSNIGRILAAGVSLIASFLHQLASTIRSGSAAIGGGITDVVDAMKDVGVNMIKGLISGVKSMAGDALSAVGDLAGSMVDKAKGAFKIFSPSRVFREIGENVVLGLSKGIRDNAAAAITSTGAMVSGTIDVASNLIDRFLADLDQKAIAATGRAEGLMAAAERAAAMADKTKNKKDDRAANRLQNKADKAAERASRLEERAADAAERADREASYSGTTAQEAADMRAEDATARLEDAKEAERDAQAAAAEAAALRKQANAKGVSNKDAKKMRERADELDIQSRKDMERYQQLLAEAGANAALSQDLQAQADLEKRKAEQEALEEERRKAAEAASSFQEEYDQAAAKDREAADYEALSDEDKIKTRRATAVELQARADRDLALAKELAFTDLEAANELAEQAMQEAQTSRDYLKEAADIEKRMAEAKDSQSTSTGGEVVNLDPTEAAALALGDYADIYNASYAAAGRGGNVEFNQYNTSPEALNPTDTYRLTKTGIDWAGDKLQPV